MHYWMRLHWTLFANYDVTMDHVNELMQKLGFDPSSPAHSPEVAAGLKIAALVLEYAQHDGANQEDNFADTTGFVPSNPLEEQGFGNPTQVNPDVWQPLLQTSCSGLKYTNRHR